MAMNDGGWSYRAVIVGGGQSGLAAAYAFISLGVRREDLLVLEAGPSIGCSWEDRWDSLRLFTPARRSALEGVAFPGSPGRYPGKSEVATYLQDYARRFRIPIRFNARVSGLRRTEAGSYELRNDGGIVEAANVVIATGPFGQPFIPGTAALVEGPVVQLHSSDYRNPGQLPEGPALVVGAGNSGIQIAEELSRSRPVALSVGSRSPWLPQRVAGQDLFGWLDVLGVMRITVGTRAGQWLSRREPVIGTSLRRLKRDGVRVVGRITGVMGGHPMAGQRVLDPASIVWATGYVPDFGWLPAEVLTPDGRPVHRRGLTPLPGLAVLGQPWLHTRGSALLGWVRHDARYVARALLGCPVGTGS